VHAESAAKAKGVGTPVQPKREDKSSHASSSDTQWTQQDCCKYV